MPLPSSGALGLKQIQTQFGGASPTGLSEYYAGGTYVPAGTLGNNGPIPSSGIIKISDFYGAPVSHIIFANTSGYALGSTVSASFSVSNDGFTYGIATKSVSGSGSLTIDGTLYGNPRTSQTVQFTPAWVPVAPTSNYSARATWSQGIGLVTPTGASLNTWLTLGTSRTWTLTSSSDDNGGTLTVQIALTTNLTNILATYVAQLQAYSAP